MTPLPTIHASAVLVGARAILIRGPSGSGKSRLAWSLLRTQKFARLIADDRVLLEPANGRLIAKRVGPLEGLIEVRGLGIRKVPHEASAVVHLVADLAAADAERLPDRRTGHAEIAGVTIARLAVAPGVEPLPLIEAFLHTASGGEAAPELTGQGSENARKTPIYRNATLPRL
jgi:serine kinase of HPr protein (carbohydrate metabolism regulator)